MKRNGIRLVAVLAVVVAADMLAPGLTEARAQYVAVPAADVYSVRVRPRREVIRYRGRVYSPVVVDPMVRVTSLPTTTYLAPAPVVQTTRVITTTPVITSTPVVVRPAYTPTIITTPVMVPRVYTTYPAVIGLP